MKKVSSKLLHIKVWNIKIIPQILGFERKFPAVHPIAKFRRFLTENCKKSALKHSTGNYKG